MQKPFTTQSELFVSSSDIDHPILHSLDDTEALLEWSKLECLLSSVYAAKTGRPSYPLLTLFRGYMTISLYLLGTQCQVIRTLYFIYLHITLSNMGVFKGVYLQYVITIFI